MLIFFWLNGAPAGGGGTTTTPPAATVTTDRQPGGFGGAWPIRHEGTVGRVDQAERKRIASEMRLLYAAVYDKAKSNEPAADDAAALVARYAPVKSPDLPLPQSIDWALIAEESAGMIAAFRGELLRIQQMLAEQDDEEAMLLLLLSD